MIDRRVSERRILVKTQAELIQSPLRRNSGERRISPAISEMAMLRARNAELLAVLRNLAFESRHYHNTGGGGSHLMDSINRANAAIAKEAP